MPRLYQISLKRRNHLKIASCLKYRRADFQAQFRRRQTAILQIFRKRLIAPTLHPIQFGRAVKLRQLPIIDGIHVIVMRIEFRRRNESGNFTLIAGAQII